jgi:kynureninase
MMSSASMISRDACVARDAADPLRGLRDRFLIPDGLIYLDGNSLGPMPRAAASALNRTIEQEWGHDLIRSWNSAGWFDMPVRLGDRVGALLGAAPGQTLVCDTTSINLYKAVHAAIGLRPGRDVVIAEDESFPTDLYIIEGAIKSAGRPMKRRLIGADGPSIDALLDETVAVAVLSHVNYRTGALLDMATITKQLHDAGALVVWDLCHSIGVVEIAFDLHAVDFAVGCTYKYLNGGPGSPAFISVAKAHQAAARHVALDAMEGVELAALRQKSLALTELFMARVTALLPGLDIVTPRQPSLRGSQVGISFDKGYAVVQAMIERGVIGDFRAPDIMRFGFAPLYIRFQDVWDAADILAGCITAEVWRDPRFNRYLDVT